ncbi:MAG: PKD domain-containing protein, partial [Flavipsychrobacter sp.]
MKYCYFLYCLLLVSVFARAQNTPIEFVENKGQWEGPFQYKALTGKGDVFLQKDGFTYLLGASSNNDQLSAYHHGIIYQPFVLKYHAYKVSFVGANNNTVIEGSKPLSWYYNYYLGNDSSKWRSGIHPYLVLNYPQLYKGIDMHVSSQTGNLKYEFIVQPGADVSQIRMKIDGADGLKLKKGTLVISTSVGDMQELKPYVYQYINNERKEIACNYSLKKNELTFDFPDGYDAGQPLIIDPTVVFCTFSGSTADNWGFTATYDKQGNFYGGGLVNGNGFPANTGAFQTTFAGGSSLVGSKFPCDIGIIKFNATGTTKIFATYIGGSSNEQPHSLIVDTGNNLILAGRSYSTDYPTTTTAYDRTQNGLADLVVTKLNSTGTSLLASTYIGGDSDDVVNFNADEYTFGNLKHNYGDDARSEVQVDNAGNVYVAACTRSDNFPVTSSAYQSTLAGTQDAVVFKLNSTLSSLTWSTYLGGSDDDAAYVLAFDTNQSHIYVAGGTQSTNFPFTSGTFHSTYQSGSADGFITKFQNGGTYSLQKSTFIGTYAYDQCYGIQVDLDNRVYAMGQTLGGKTFPVTSGVYSNPYSSQFIIKLDSNLSTDIYSTVFGSGDSTGTNISPVAFLVDTCQNVYISGWGGNLGFSLPGRITVSGMPITSSTAIKTTTDGYDFYFIVLSKDASSLLYGSYFGRNSTDAWKGEHVDGGTSRFDKNGIIYQAICGGCEGSTTTYVAFPTTKGAYAEVDGSSNCNLAALKIEFDLGAVIAKASASPNAKGCSPFTVHFNDSSANATSYTWDFGDGGTDTAKTPVHTFYGGGVYNVRLVVYNPKACKELDTAYLTITVDTNFEHPAFSYTVVDSCNPYTVAFTNNSVYSSTPGSSTFTRFTWLFGDGTSYSGTNPSTHNYPGPGAYTVSLVMIDSTACNSPDTISSVVHINNIIVTAGLNGPDSVCLGSSANFTDASQNGTSYSWSFGDGATASSSPASHIYDSAGTYTVIYIVSNPSSCNGADTVIKTIKVMTPPVADFTYSPLTPETNVPTSFTNLSVNATSYLWDFGDATTTTDVNPSHFYKRTGDYKVCLTAKNASKCPATACKIVSADVRPLADLPTAFSPNGDGKNDMLFVRGAAIQTMDVKV